MPKQILEKCRRCAKLSAEVAKAKHRDNCWDPKWCHRCRSPVRHRQRVN